jgi:hypothetical protein
METAKVLLHKLIQDSQDFGSDKEHMVSRAFFSFDVGEKHPANLYVNIKLAVGTSSENDPSEVGHREGIQVRSTMRPSARTLKAIFAVWSARRPLESRSLVPQTSVCATTRLCKRKRLSFPSPPPAGGWWG